MRKLLIVCAAAGSAALLSGCAATGSVSKGDKQFARGQYELAIPLYKADVAKGKNAALANFRIGESYRLSNRVEMAEPFYKAALDGGVKNAEVGFRYAEALRANGKYDEAAAQFASYASSGTNRSLAARAETESKNAVASKGCDHQKQIRSDPGRRAEFAGFGLWRYVGSQHRRPSVYLRPRRQEVPRQWRELQQLVRHQV
jgi:tetratricopeptide (TPR) repeat protein